MAFIDVSEFPLDTRTDPPRDTRTNDAADVLTRASELGGTLYFPAVGSPYAVVRTLEVAGARTQLIGQGPAASVLRYTGSDIALGINRVGVFTPQFAIRDLALIGGAEDLDPAKVTDDPVERDEARKVGVVKHTHAEALSSHPRIGIEIGGASRGHRSASGLLDNVKVTGFRNAGIRAVATAGISFQHVICDFNGIGFLAESTVYEEDGEWKFSANNANQFYGCQFRRNAENGVKLSGRTRGNSFYSCWFEDNQTEGVRLPYRNFATAEALRLLLYPTSRPYKSPRDSLDANGFYNCWFESNHGAHLKVDTEISFGAAGIDSLGVVNCAFGPLDKLWVDPPPGSPPHILLDGPVNNVMIGPNAHGDPDEDSPHVGIHLRASGTVMAVGSISDTGWKVWSGNPPGGYWRDWDPAVNPHITVYWVGFTPGV